MSTILLLVFSFLAVYGGFQFFVKLIFGHKRTKDKGINYHHTLSVKDAGDTIESVIRAISFEDIREDVIVVDLGSKDDTFEIVKRLEMEYDFLRVMNIEEYKTFILSV